MQSGGNRAVRILHLSDIHFRNSTAWDARPVLQALTESLTTTVDEVGPPDLVAITGDLAFSGKDAEYKLALAWLDQLWSRFGDLPKDRLLLVPGNHDVDRSKVTRGVRMRQDALLNGRSQDDIADLLRDDDERASLLKRHAAYLAFVSDWFGEPQRVPWWRRPFEINGVRLHVAGLDFAWMASGDGDRGRLLLGRWQIHELVVAADAEHAHWRMALLHHPWDYLAEFDHEEAQALVQRNCDLLLRGHRHRTDPQSVARPDPNDHCVELAAGCVYEESQYPNAFQWIELLSPPGKQLKVRFHVWHEGVWIVDRNRVSNGCWEVNLAPDALKNDTFYSRTRQIPEVHKWFVLLRKAIYAIAKRQLIPVSIDTNTNTLTFSDPIDVHMVLGLESDKQFYAFTDIYEFWRLYREHKHEGSADSFLARCSPLTILDTISLVKQPGGCRSLIHAPGGFGKTSYLLRLVEFAIKDGGIMPVVFSMTVGKSPETLTLTSFVELYCIIGGYDLDALLELLSKAQDSGLHILFVVDGINHQTAHSWDEILKCIEGMLSKTARSNNSIIVADRMTERKFEHGPFSTWTLAPLSRTLIDRYIHAKSGLDISGLDPDWYDILDTPLFLSIFQTAGATGERPSRSRLVERYLTASLPCLDPKQIANVIEDS